MLGIMSFIAIFEPLLFCRDSPCSWCVLCVS